MPQHKGMPPIAATLPHACMIIIAGGAGIQHYLECAQLVPIAGEKPNHRHRLLRPRRNRPRCRRAAEKGDELATLNHSMTSSARSRNASEIVRPSALAVLRLTISSNLVGCSTGRSAGFAPLRIFAT
jgi:hypothetical protein